MILAAAAIVIHAVLPVAAGLEAREALRKIAADAGCQAPVVAMRVKDGQVVEIQVTCREEGRHR